MMWDRAGAHKWVSFVSLVSPLWCCLVIYTLTELFNLKFPVCVSQVGILSQSSL